MTQPFDAAVVFDVDGPLLNLTAAEEDAFFQPFAELYGLTGLSRDWDGYKVRNDVAIIEEILEEHFGQAPQREVINRLLGRYEQVLRQGYDTGALRVETVAGARELVADLAAMEHMALGTATANVRFAARHRLERAGMWQALKAFPGAADEGGAKRDVLARVIAALGLPAERIVFIGDNLNDVEAGLANDVHFIGFAESEDKRRRLAAAGAAFVCGDHGATRARIGEVLRLEGL